LQTRLKTGIVQLNFPSRYSADILCPKDAKRGVFFAAHDKKNKQERGCGMVSFCSYFNPKARRKLKIRFTNSGGQNVSVN
jgi:hypothetical protein